MVEHRSYQPYTLQPGSGGHTCHPTEDPGDVEIIEKIIDVPEIQVVERVVPVRRVVEKEKIIEVKKKEIVEKKVYVPKIKDVERIVEVPQVHYKQVPHKRIVNVPEVQYKEVTREVEVPAYKTVGVGVPRPVGVEKPIDRNVPMPVNMKTTQVYNMPKLKPAYTEIQVPIYVPRYIEVPVPAQLIGLPSGSVPPSADIPCDAYTMQQPTDLTHAPEYMQAAANTQVQQPGPDGTLISNHHHANSPKAALDAIPVAHAPHGENVSMYQQNHEYHTQQEYQDNSQAHLDQGSPNLAPTDVVA